MKVFSCEIKSSIDVADSLQDDEVAAAIGAVQHYLDQEARVAQLVAQKTPANTISPWLQSSREFGLSQTVESPRGKNRAKLWGSSLLALALSFCMQTARAQEADYVIDTTDSDGQLLAVLNKARTGGNNLISANRVRVCLASGVSKIDLDTPDGASIYSLADGAIVAKTGTQSSFSLNLANTTANGVARPKLALKGKTDR
ncbi:MAG: SpoIID/LytB protein, partial [Cyanobacteriota bacterium erpe_2018_sw_39hr_WHONDRS-SW48-000098_B_bin.30]|nr:SpoIID/LytB protein [Cyanobacteriota bacterium erpe_2018_sw_39hr_WHONDRS-SW48-000098_B_bin.30]